ncbi:hypothetical protein AWB68_04042 [Caballeronia choica]|uniref:Uncharacterized protein n=1 Tax=Caballeronia choica TaxID=326476 RepID=A0A158JPM0_9BURK|nr:hypothetical protein AWB68_04042 [Caballeronia choica]
MLPLLSLHALASRLQNGDGLRPELLALFERQIGSTDGLVAPFDPPFEAEAVHRDDAQSDASRS